MARGRANRSQESVETLNDEVVNKIIKIREGSAPVRIRAGAGLSFPHVDGKYIGKGVFEVDEVSQGPGSKSGWGHLVNGDGWVAMDFVEIVK